MPKPPLSLPEKKLENGVELSALSAYYGGLLTEKQRQALALHFDEDYSLGEIAEALGVSRQNVHDLIARSADKLRACEAVLGMAGRMEGMLRELTAVQALLRQAARQPLPPEASAAIGAAEKRLDALLAGESR